MLLLIGANKSVILHSIRTKEECQMTRWTVQTATLIVVLGEGWLRVLFSGDGLTYLVIKIYKNISK
jgi:hypothetical protein